MEEIRIIKILSTTKVIINAGRAQGISEKDAFYILDNEKYKLYDPYEKKVLAERIKYKDKIIAVTVEDNYSICRARQTVLSSGISTIGSALEGLAINKINITSPVEVKQEELNVDPDDIDDFFGKYSNKIIEVGDIVVEASD